MIARNPVDLACSLNSASWNVSMSAHAMLDARQFFFFCNKCGLSLDEEGSVISLLVRNHFLLDGHRIVLGPLSSFN